MLTDSAVQVGDSYRAIAMLKREIFPVIGPRFSDNNYCSIIYLETAEAASPF